ncbi:hypothetical protein BU16DRAFT_558397 [Lophium mytilinum]|uniref:Uncharacterized protein n=1 Tax=Lophium mytilinum TaxID=390894 RepID=A0A6A6R251_9PEZI|nr:hypothetical protein BU16DRAFT_558397 [Lophium mytilinum]
MPGGFDAIQYGLIVRHSIEAPPPTRRRLAQQHRDDCQWNAVDGLIRRHGVNERGRTRRACYKASSGALRNVSRRLLRPRLVDVPIQPLCTPAFSLLACGQAAVQKTPSWGRWASFNPRSSSQQGRAIQASSSRRLNWAYVRLPCQVFLQRTPSPPMKGAINPPRSPSAPKSVA